MNREQVLQLIQQHFRTNYLSGAPDIPPHTHNGIDNLPIPYANLAGLPILSIGGLNGYQIFTSSGTFVVPSGFTNFLVTAIGSGQGGGSITSPSTGAGSGGLSGVYCQSLVSPTGSVTVTIGSAGVHDANGGDVSFGSLVVAPGGGSSTLAVGILIIVAQSGSNTFFSTSGTIFGISGSGGNTPLGIGGASVYGKASSSQAGLIGNGYGSGGGGALEFNAGTTVLGGSGTKGIVLITW